MKLAQVVLKINITLVCMHKNNRRGGSNLAAAHFSKTNHAKLLAPNGPSKNNTIF